MFGLVLRLYLTYTIQKNSTRCAIQYHADSPRLSLSSHVAGRFHTAPVFLFFPDEASLLPAMWETSSGPGYNNKHLTWHGWRSGNMESCCRRTASIPMKLLVISCWWVHRLVLQKARNGTFATGTNDTGQIRCNKKFSDFDNDEKPNKALGNQVNTKPNKKTTITPTTTACSSNCSGTSSLVPFGWNTKNIRGVCIVF